MQHVFQARVQSVFTVALIAVAVVAFSLSAVAQGPMSPFSEGGMPRVGNTGSTAPNLMVSTNQSVAMEQPNLSSVDMWYQLAELNSLVNQQQQEIALMRSNLNFKNNPGTYKLFANYEIGKLRKSPALNFLINRSSWPKTPTQRNASEKPTPKRSVSTILWAMTD